MDKEKEIMITVSLSNGQLVRIPYKDYQKTIERMEKEIAKKTKNSA